MKNKRPLIVILIVSALLLIPLIAMQFTSEVQWSAFDFIMAGLLLSVTGLTLENIIRKVNRPVVKISLSIFILVALVLVWLELAVGIFGTGIGGQ